MSDEIKNVPELTEQKLDEVVGGFSVAKHLDKASPKVSDELPAEELDKVTGGSATPDQQVGLGIRKSSGGNTSGSTSSGSTFLRYDQAD